MAWKCTAGISHRSINPTNSGAPRRVDRHDADREGGVAPGRGLLGGLGQCDAACIPRESPTQDRCRLSASGSSATLAAASRLKISDRSPPPASFLCWGTYHAGRGIGGIEPAGHRHQSGVQECGKAVQLYPDFAALRWEAAGCTPLKVVGPEVDRARARLLRTASKLGSMAPPHCSARHRLHKSEIHPVRPLQRKYLPRLVRRRDAKP